MVLRSSGETKRVRQLVPETEKKNKTSNRYIKTNKGTIKLKPKYNLLNLSDESKTTTVIWTPNIRRAYIFHILVRLVMELVFFYLLYLNQTEMHQSTKVILIPSTCHIPKVILFSL